MDSRRRQYKKDDFILISTKVFNSMDTHKALKQREAVS